MSIKSNKLHLDGNATPHKGVPCKKCIPFMTFKVTMIMLAGSLIGMAGLVVVEDTPAAQLIRNSSIQVATIISIENQLAELNDTMERIKIDVNTLRQQIQTK